MSTPDSAAKPAASVHAPADPLTPEQSAWLRALAGPHRRSLVWAGVLPVLSAGLLLWQAGLLARVLHEAIVQGATRQALLADMLTLGVLIVVRAALAGWSERIAQQAAERLRTALRQRLYDAVLDAGPLWSRSRESGELAHLLTGQVEALEGYFARYLPAMWSAAVVPLVFALALFPVDWVAGALLLFTLPMIPLFMALVGWGAEAASRRHADALTRLSGFFVDRVRGMLTLRLYGQAHAQARRVQQAAGELVDRTMAVMRLAFLSSAVLEFFAALGVAGMAVYIGLSYLGMLDLRGSPFTLQAGLFCLLIAPEAYMPLRQFAAHYHDRGAARAAVAHMAAMFAPHPLPADADTADGAGEAPTVRVTGPLALHIDRAGLPPLLRAAVPEPWVLRPGEHVALMGVSGSGKTTFLETLCGLRGHADGILLGGMPLAAWPLQALREQVVLIGQRPYLHAGSLAENIRLGREGATREQVADAAQRAGVMAFAARWPQGLDTVVGHHGQGLSGGQRQRVALARLYLRDPGLILLDEPTAHLDPVTAADVMDAVMVFAQGRSLVLATHSVEAAARCPRVWRLAGEGGAP